VFIRGKWIVLKVTTTNSEEIVYQPDPDKPDESIMLLKIDDNVLFFLIRTAISWLETTNLATHSID